MHATDASSHSSAVKLNFPVSYKRITKSNWFYTTGRPDLERVRCLDEHSKVFFLKKQKPLWREFKNISKARLIIER